MDKISARIIAHPAQAERQGGAPEQGQGRARNADVECAAFQVQAVFRHLAAAAQEMIVVLRRTVTGDHMDFVAAAEPGAHVVEIFKGIHINGTLLVRMVASQQPVQLPEGLGIVPAVPLAIRGVEFFAGMEIVQAQPARRLFCPRETGQRLFRMEKGKGGGQERGDEEKASARGNTNGNVLLSVGKNFPFGEAL